MKCVIFICLLSLSVCFSLPAAQEGTPPAQTGTNTAPQTETKTTVKPSVEPPVAQASNNSVNGTSVKPNQEAVPTPTLPPQSNDSKPADNKPAEKEAKPETKPDVKPDQEAAKTTVKPAEASDKKEATTVAPDGKKNDTKPEDDKKETTTPKSAVEVSSQAPPAVQASRAFDGASFVGGIILTLGLLAIGFMGFKYYKNQTERNYHTL